MLTCFAYHSQLTLSSYRAHALCAYKLFHAAGVFGHRAILIRVDRGMAGGFSFYPITDAEPATIL